MPNNKAHFAEIAKRTFVVYAMCDPRNGYPMYVGITSNLKKREKTHSKWPQKFLRDWILELRSLGMKPYAIELMEVLGIRNAWKHERDCIYELGLVYPLLNVSGSVEERRRVETRGKKAS